jgi:outer membrane PBP1 activator LpoA protein
MNHVQLIGIVAFAAVLTGCETTEQTAGQGNQERKRLAQIQQENAQAAQSDESERNLWNAEQDILLSGTNPAIRYR